MPYDAELADRIRRGLTGPDAREVAMFGGRCFMVHEQLAVCAASDGTLLLRCAPDDVEQLLHRTGTRRAEMRGKPMSPGWLRVDVDAVADDEVLDEWIERAVAHAAERAATT